MKHKKRGVKRNLWILWAVIGVFLLLAMVGIYSQNSRPQLVMGLVNGMLREIPDKDNAVSTQTALVEKSVDALPMKKTLLESVNAMKEALMAYGRIEIVEETDSYIYAVATTGIMRFHDDIEIYFDETAGVVHYRSASRAGYSDMGLNKERYNQIAEDYLNN